MSLICDQYNLFPSDVTVIPFKSMHEFVYGHFNSKDMHFYKKKTFKGLVYFITHYR